MRAGTLFMVVGLVSSAQVLSVACAEHSDKPDSGGKRDVTITLLQLRRTEDTIEIRYRIENDSPSDVWLCDDIEVPYLALERYVDQDLETLKVCRRLAVPIAGTIEQPIVGRYGRLPPLQRRTESLLFQLPVHWWSGFRLGAVGPSSTHDLVMKRLVLEIGFYNGNLAETALNLTKDLPEAIRGGYPQNAGEWLGGLKGLLWENEPLSDRGERVAIPYTHQTFQGEQVARLVVDDLSIPWRGARSPDTQTGGQLVPVSPLPGPRLERATRAEIEFSPSMLEYFYAYPSQQALLSPSENEFLRAQKKIVVADEASLKVFARDVAKCFQCEMVSEGNRAEVVRYCDDKRLMPLTIYDNTGVETPDKQRFRRSDGLQSVRQMVEVIQPFELRLQCADKLKDLWYRLRWYHYVMNPGESESSAAKVAYPSAGE
jgi:hypothetical protein